MMNESTRVVVVSARPCPQGCSLSLGLDIIALITSVTIAMSTSVEESIPSPITARDFEKYARRIFMNARAAFPISAIVPATLM